MGSRLNLRRFAFGLITAGLISVPFLFQNCAAPLDASRDVSSVASSMPFAFEANLDHLAYMSCSFVSGSANPDAYFTFKVGAYNDGNGVRLNEDFFYHTRNLVNNDKVEALRQSTTNTGVYASLAVRQTSNYQSRRPESLGTFVGPLTTSSIASSLVSSRSNRVKTFGSDKFEDVLQFNQNEDLAEFIRTGLQQNTAMLTLNFGQAGQSAGYALGPQVNSTDRIYGLGYTMNFVLGRGQTSNYTSGNTRVVTNVQEIDLLSGQPTSSSWNCDANWRFMIVRPQDLQNVNFCQVGPGDPTPANATQQAMLAALRAVLPTEQWAVNLNQRCIVPRTGNDLCYGSGTFTINYNGDTCDPATRSCPHFLSVCKRL